MCTSAQLFRHTTTTVSLYYAVEKKRKQLVYYADARSTRVLPMRRQVIYAYYVENEKKTCPKSENLQTRNPE